MSEPTGSKPTGGRQPTRGPDRRRRRVPRRRRRQVPRARQSLPAEFLSFVGFGVEVYGEGCYIEDHEGHRYLDCLGGYGTFALGHRHPTVVAAVKDQLDSLAMSGKAFFSKPAADLAAELASIAPAGLQYSFFSNSGSEAVEAALKFAKVATGRSRIISTEGGYHGKTLGALATTGREKYRTRVEPLMPGVEFVPYGDAVAAVAAIDDETAAIIVEPIQGEGGIHVPPDGYLRAIREACDRTGALDDRRRGADLHRTHRGHVRLRPRRRGPRHHDPGEAARRGHHADRCDHGHSFGVGEGVLREPADAHLHLRRQPPGLCRRPRSRPGRSGRRPRDRSHDRGALMLELLREMQAKHRDLVVDVRGRGLMIGVEFARDEVAELTVMQMLKHGMCAAFTLNNPRVIRLEPPLIISEDDVRTAVEILDRSLTETAGLMAMPT